MDLERHEQAVKASPLTRFSLDRRITVLVLFCTVMVVGFIATKGIPLELFPRGYTSDFLMVNVPWREAPSQEILDKITLPLEEELSTVKGLDRLASFTSRNNASVYLTFKQGVDMDVAYREVRDRVERARALFPSDAERVFIRKQDVSGFPVYLLGLSVDADLLDPYNLIQKQVVLPISRLDGVANVQVHGLEEKEILIEIDRKKMESHGLNIYDLASELSGDNFSLASGSIHDRGKTFLLRSVARYQNVTELENRPVAQDIALKDIASVSYDEPEKDYRVRVNSQPAYAVLVMKEGQANTIEVCDAVENVVAELEANPRLASVYITKLFSQGDLIMESLGSVVSSGQIGAIFAMVVLFFFLRRFRLTTIITLSIPLSLVMALVVMFFVGETLNMFSLLGLVICVGLLVDNSVVVAENVHRWFKEGHDRREACLKGAGEMGLAIVMATLTTVAVFLPVSLVEGQGQFFMLRMAIPITVSLVASLLVALIFIPLAVYLTIPEHEGDQKDSAWRRLHLKLNAFMGRVYDVSFGRLNRIYTAMLSFFLQRRMDLVLVLLLVFGVTGGVVGPKLEIKAVDDEDQNHFEIKVDLPETYTFEEAVAFFDACEKVLATKDEELGLEYYFVFHQRVFGEIQGAIDKELATMSPKEMAKIIHDELPKAPGVTYYLGSEDRTGGNTEKETFPLALLGDDHQQLEEIAEQLEDLLVKVPGVLGMRQSEETAPNELGLRIDRDRAQTFGVNPEVVAGVVGYALRGTGLPRFRSEGKEIPVRIRFQEEDRDNLGHLGSFAVPSEEGSFLPLSTLTEVEMMKAARGIYRENKKMTRKITLELDPEQAEATRERLMAILGSINLPEGVRFNSQKLTGGDNEDVENMAMAALLSLVFIYLLMGFLFESFTLPMSIILTVPLALVGVGWTHFAFGHHLDILGIIGIILLIGVVVNNGIVLIDYVNRLREDGFSRTEALCLASERRFRPIAMTALTTICGMVPLAFSEPTSIGLNYVSFGLTLIGGMSTATLMTLLVVPVFYTLIDDASKAFMATVQPIFGGRKKSRESPQMSEA